MSTEADAEAAAQAQAEASEVDSDEEEQEQDVAQQGQVAVQQGARPTALTARVGELPVEWTQMNADNKKSPADRLRYPHDAAELNATDTDIMIVGTAGQKITQIGPDFSTNGQVNPDITELVLRSHLIRNMEGLEGFTKLELLELYDNQIEELKCLDKGEHGAPGPTLRVLDMSYNMIREMKPVALCPNLQELCKYGTVCWHMRLFCLCGVDSYVLYYSIATSFCSSFQTPPYSLHQTWPTTNSKPFKAYADLVICARLI
jgi:hypothetical protein